MAKTVKINTLFRNLQKQMLARLQTDNNGISHPVSKGDATELNWVAVLNDYLPTRYEASKAFVLDSKGKLSDQIDIVIYDRHYSPFLFNQDGTVYIPAESVYAVIEVKQTLDKKNLTYASSKAASVRKLVRTSVPIRSAGGELPAKIPHDILAGIITLDASWKPPFGKPFTDLIKKTNKMTKMDFGCVLKSGSFRISYEDKLTIETSNSKDSLIFFFLTLLSRLQSLATVPAMDIQEYEKALKK